MVKKENEDTGIVWDRRIRVEELKNYVKEVCCVLGDAFGDKGETGRSL
ncbi:MAG: hypothetical protein ACO2OY_10460 [Thermodesulfobacteriaceae bacterium]